MLDNERRGTAEVGVAAFEEVMTEPLYSIGTWDTGLPEFSPQVDVLAFNLTRKQMVESIRMLQGNGYPCHRFRGRDEDGQLNARADDSDPSVLIERTDGMSEVEILKRWQR